MLKEDEKRLRKQMGADRGREEAEKLYKVVDRFTYIFLFHRQLVVTHAPKNTK